MDQPCTNPARVFEYCEDCGTETHHSVGIQIREESQERVGYSREPYRVSVCDQCETTTRVRMNNQ